jgi:hypothetical protein
MAARYASDPGSNLGGGIILGGNPWANQGSWLGRPLSAMPGMRQQAPVAPRQGTVPLANTQHPRKIDLV